MKYNAGFLLAALLLCIPPAAQPSRAAAPDTASDFAHETPLIIIRFNQAHVDYPTPLYNTISEALKARPSAVFDIISVAPRAREAHNQPYYNRMAAQNTHKVLTTLHQIGVPATRISLIDAVDSVSASEVRIFVH
jgi:hypothetical protein